MLFISILISYGKFGRVEKYFKDNKNNINIYMFFMNVVIFVESFT